MRTHILVITLGIILTIILTWPLALNITSYYTDQGDYPLAGSVLWYNQDSIKTGRIFNQKEYLKGYQFYPQAYSLAFANNSFSPSLIFAPIYWLTNNLAFSVNSYIMLTLILSFITSFYMIYYFTKNKWASIVGAFIFTFNAQTMVRFPQHLDILGRYFLPLVFLFAYQLLEKPSFKRSLLLWLFFTLNALTVSYYQIFSTIFLPILALPFLINAFRKRTIALSERSESKGWGYLGNLGKVSLVGLIFVPILLYFNLPYLQFSQKEGAVRPLEATPFFSARITDWFTPSPDNLIYGGWVKSIDQIRGPKDDRGILNYEEHTLFLGLVPLILFFLGIKAFQKQKINHTFFYLLLIIPFLLSWGPYFNGADAGFPLPFYFFYKLFPFLSGIRVPSRFEFLMFLPFILIVSFGAQKLMMRWKDKQVWVVAVILLLLILENLTPKSYNQRSVLLSKVDEIGKQNLEFLEGKITLHLPIYTTDDADEFGKNSGYLNWLTKTKEKLFNGNSAYLPPDQLYILAQIRNNLDQKALEELIALGINYVIVHKDLSLKDYSILQKSLIFSQQEVKIYDLSKLGLKISLCSFNKDIEIKVVQARDDNFNISPALSLKNKSNCYLANLFDDRYRQIETEIDGIKKTIFYRLPIIIGPGEEIILSEINREVRIK